jgi:hypothetical protein
VGVGGADRSWRKSTGQAPCTCGTLACVVHGALAGKKLCLGPFFLLEHNPPAALISLFLSRSCCCSAPRPRLNSPARRCSSLLLALWLWWRLPPTLCCSARAAAEARPRPRCRRAARGRLCPHTAAQRHNTHTHTHT